MGSPYLETNPKWDMVSHVIETAPFFVVSQERAKPEKGTHKNDNSRFDC